MVPSSYLRRAAACVLATLVVVGTGAIRPVLAYAAGGELDPARCTSVSDSSTKVGTIETAWHITRLTPSKVWDVKDAKGLFITGAGVRIAVIDTAAQITVSPYLRGGNAPSGAKPTWQMVNYAGDEYQRSSEYANGFGLDCAHGTRVVSLINAQVLPESKSNFSGMAPGSSVMVMRGLKESSARIPESQQPTAQAIVGAVQAGAEIINISQAGSDDTELAAAVAYAIDHGVIVVASSGNEGKAGPRYPAAYPGVISVGMTTTADAAHESSEQGVDVDVTVAAPGDAIVGLLPSDPKSAASQSSKAFLSTSQVWNSELGTSFAAPIVTGVVALMLQKAKAEGVKLTPAEVKRRLQVTADPPPGAVPDAQLGYGVVNPERAVFGPFAETVATPSPRPSASAGPLVIPPERDTSVMLVAVVVTLGVLVLLFGALLLREALGPARARKYAPARPGE
ncbi:MAG: S8 family serine peptidase [Propionibacteriaceae bacterium]